MSRQNIGLQWLCHLFQPLERSGIDERTEYFVDTPVVAVEPTPFLGCQHLTIDQSSIDRSKGQRLERIERLLCPNRLRCCNHKHQVLDADSVRSGFVIARLVREDHATAKGNRAQL